MSSKNNVNPDYYKVGGSLRPDEAILHNQEKQEYTQSRSESEEENFIPGAPAKDASQKHPKPEKNIKKRRG